MKDNQLVNCTISIEPAYLIILIILAVMGWENVFSPARLFHYQFAWQILELPGIKINLHSLLTFTYKYTVNYQLCTQHQQNEPAGRENVVSLMLLIVFLYSLLIIWLKDINLYLRILEDEGYWDGFLALKINIFAIINHQVLVHKHSSNSSIILHRSSR